MNFQNLNTPTLQVSGNWVFPAPRSSLLPPSRPSFPTRVPLSLCPVWWVPWPAQNDFYFPKRRNTNQRNLKRYVYFSYGYEDPPSIKEILNDILYIFSHSNSHNNVSHNGLIQWPSLLPKKWDSTQKVKG